jgi:hypothetical protein
MQRPRAKVTIMDLTLVAAAVAALGSVAGPVVLYFTRKGAINDRLNDRIDRVRNEVHKDIGLVNERVHADVDRVEQVDREAKARSGEQQNELRSIARDMAFLAGRQAERDAPQKRAHGTETT